MNVGLRRRKDKHIKGYLLDTLDGRWAQGRRPGQERRQAKIPRIRMVIPYVEDHRNAL